MTQYKFVKMNLKTYKKFRRMFPAKYKESAAHYFERLANWMYDNEYMVVDLK